jgi:hypothetical protein
MKRMVEFMKEIGVMDVGMDMAVSCSPKATDMKAS